jgi:hypothetical protein
LKKNLKDSPETAPEENLPRENRLRDRPEGNGICIFLLGTESRPFRNCLSMHGFPFAQYCIHVMPLFRFRFHTKYFYIIFSVSQKKSLTFIYLRCMVLKILRQNAQRSGSGDPSCSTVRDCLGYTVRMMRKQFRLKSSSAGRSGAIGCAVAIALNFRPPARKGLSRQII